MPSSATKTANGPRRAGRPSPHDDRDPADARFSLTNGWAATAIVTLLGITLLIASGQTADSETPPIAEGPAPAPSTQTTTATPVTVGEFCAAIKSMNDATEAFLDAPSPTATAELRAAAAAAAHLAPGVAELSPGARAGLTYIATTIATFPDDATTANFQAMDSDATPEDIASAQALGSFVMGTCNASE